MRPCQSPRQVDFRDRTGGGGGGGGPVPGLGLAWEHLPALSFYEPSRCSMNHENELEDI